MSQMDASDLANSVVLRQEAKDGAEHTVAYYRRKLLPCETRYPVVEQECLAIVAAVQNVRIYLERTRFVAETDHHPLKYLYNMWN